MHHKRTESQATRLNDVIVIGAGLSGLSAAKVCHDKGLNVLVLEARDRVGGQTLSDENGCDLGGSYFIQDHRNLFNLIAELGLKYQPDVPPVVGGVPCYYSNEKKFKFHNPLDIAAGNGQSIASIHQPKPGLPFASKFDFIVQLDYLATKRKINKLSMQIDLNEPWNTKDAKKLDSMTWKQFLESTCYTSSVRSFFLHFLTPINLTNEAEDCSLLFALCFIRSWGGIERIIGMDSGGTSRVVGGAQLISTRLSQQIGEERVLLNKPVHTIDQQTNSELVTVMTKDGSKYEASRVIVALPRNLQASITFKPHISLKSQLNQRSPAGLCTKVILYYDHAYWYDNGFNGHLNVIDHIQASDRLGNRNKFTRSAASLERRKSKRYSANGGNNSTSCTNQGSVSTNQTNASTNNNGNNGNTSNTNISSCNLNGTSCNIVAGATSAPGSNVNTNVGCVSSVATNMVGSSSARNRPEYRRSLVGGLMGNKTSSSSEKDDNLHASTNSLLLIPQNNGCGVGLSAASSNDQMRLLNPATLMLKETKESFYPSSCLDSCINEDYCPVSFVTPDYSRGQPSLIAHICGTAWIKYHQIEKQEDRIALVAKSYARILHPSLMEPLSYKELNWVSEEYSRGAYTSILTPGTITKFGRLLHTPFNRIAFACSELSCYWPFTMEGAIRSGRKAAIKILEDLQRLDVDEIDILDDEEVLVQTPETFLEEHANKLLHLANFALKVPAILLAAAFLGFSIHKVSFRYRICL